MAQTIAAAQKCRRYRLVLQRIEARTDRRAGRLYRTPRQFPLLPKRQESDAVFGERDETVQPVANGIRSSG
jgi:hypothetical protein